MEMWTIVIIGLGTVFLCLIALMLMLSLFKVLFAGSKRKSEANPAAKAAPAARHGVDAAVVAVIVAAISAASGVPASALQITSIERTGFNTPAWGHVERIVGTRLPGAR